MFNVGGGEVLVILLIALIVLGPDKLPNAARQAGKYLGDFRRMSHGFQRELRDAMDLGDLGDLMSGKPVSPGGPTPQPTTTTTPAADATPVDASSVGPEVATSADGAVAGNGSAGASSAGDGAVVMAANGAASADDGGVVVATETGAVTNGSSAGTGTAVVRKRSIEVDGPSTSFD